MGSLLIDGTLAGVAKEYRPGLLAWLKSQPDRWSRLLQLEDHINRTTLAGDEEGLKEALAAYKAFFREMLERYVMSNTLPLFGCCDNGGMRR